MAGFSFKQLAQEKGLSFQDHTIFGWFNGYYVTLGLAWPSYRFCIYLPDGLFGKEPPADGEPAQAQLMRTAAGNALEGLLRTYKCFNIAQTPGGQGAAVEFQAAFKVIKRMGEFLDEAVGKIAALGIPSAKLCAHCGQPVDVNEVPVKIRGDIFPMHDHCSDNITLQQAWTKEPKKGSLSLGILGAALAAVIGAVPWAAAYALGYMASLVGILIGFLVSKGYDLFHGRQGRVKIAVVLLFVLVSVALGQVAGTSYSLLQEYDHVAKTLQPGETMAVERTEALQFAWTQIVLPDSELMGGIVKDFLMGVFFALLGCFSMFRQIARDTAPNKPKRLTYSA